MADPQQRPVVPPDVTESGERIAGRPYESDFARLPAEETLPHEGVGSGPSGTVAAGFNVPLAVMAVGALLLFGVFFVATPILLVVGLLLVLVGFVMSQVKHRRPGRGGGIGKRRVPRR